MSRWIVIVADLSHEGETGHRDVLIKGKDTILGSISYYAPWRTYCFFPLPGSFFEEVCLRDIASFIEEQMQTRKHASHSNAKPTKSKASSLTP